MKEFTQNKTVFSDFETLQSFAEINIHSLNILFLFLICIQINYTENNITNECIRVRTSDIDISDDYERMNGL